MTAVGSGGWMWRSAVGLLMAGLAWWLQNLWTIQHETVKELATLNERMSGVTANLNSHSTQEGHPQMSVRASVLERSGAVRDERIARLILDIEKLDEAQVKRFDALEKLLRKGE